MWVHSYSQRRIDETEDVWYTEHIDKIFRLIHDRKYSIRCKAKNSQAINNNYLADLSRHHFDICWVRFHIECTLFWSFIVLLRTYWKDDLKSSTLNKSFSLSELEEFSEFDFT